MTTPTQNAEAERLARLTAMMADHRATFGKVLEIAARHSGHHAMEGYAMQARDGLKAIDRAMKFPILTPGFNTLGEWGSNGHAPRIASLLRSAELCEAREVAA